MNPWASGRYLYLCLYLYGFAEEFPLALEQQHLLLSAQSVCCGCDREQRVCCS
jgi:hypothetical protein